MCTVSLLQRIRQEQRPQFLLARGIPGEYLNLVFTKSVVSDVHGHSTSIEELQRTAMRPFSLSQKSFPGGLYAPPLPPTPVRTPGVPSICTRLNEPDAPSGLNTYHRPRAGQGERGRNEVSCSTAKSKPPSAVQVSFR